MNPQASTIENCAGVALVRQRAGTLELLMLRVRKDTWELPKGHVEVGESLEQAAAREFVEETGLLAPELPALRPLDTLEYVFQRDGVCVQKRVVYFLGLLAVEPRFRRPARTRELRWVAEEEVSALALPTEQLRRVVERVFAHGAS